MTLISIALMSFLEHEAVKWQVAKSVFLVIINFSSNLRCKEVEVRVPTNVLC